MSPLRHELALDFIDERRVDDDRVLGRAEQAVVEGLAGDDVAHRLRDVRRPLDVRRRVARADAVGGLPGAVRGAHQAHPAGGEDDGGFASLHQFLRAFERHLGHPVDRALRRSGLPRGLVHQLRRPA